MYVIFLRIKTGYHFYTFTPYRTRIIRLTCCTYATTFHVYGNVLYVFGIRPYMELDGSHTGMALSRLVSSNPSRNQWHCKHQEPYGLHLVGRRGLSAFNSILPVSHRLKGSGFEMFIRLYMYLKITSCRLNVEDKTIIHRRCNKVGLLDM